MGEYLERRELIKDILEMKKYQIDVDDVIEMIANTEKADVEPVKYGKWINRELTDNPAVIRYRCSECYRYIETIFPRETKDYPYCHCGAKMDLR